MEENKPNPTEQATPSSAESPTPASAPTQIPVSGPEPDAEPTPVTPFSSSSETPVTPPPNDEKPKVVVSNMGKSNKIPILILILILLVGAAVAYYFLVMKKDTKPAAHTNTTQTSQAQQAAATPLPDNVAYAFQNKATNPYSVFWRPAAGGDRTEVGPLPADIHIDSSDTYGNEVVYSTEHTSTSKTAKAIWLSTDSGKTYAKLADLKTDDQVTSLTFSSDGSQVVAAILPEAAGKNTVKTFDVKTKASKDLMTGDTAGIFLLGYDGSKQQLLYWKGCYNCDGLSVTKIYLRDTAKNTEKIIVNTDKDNLSSIAVSPNFDSFVAVKETYNPKYTSEADAFTPPYDVSTYSLTDGKATQLATFGSAAEKNSDGSYKYWGSKVGYTADTKAPYWTQGADLKLNKDSNLFEAKNTILSVLYASANNVVAGSGTYSSYTLDNFDVKANKVTNILNGDQQTILFGVTTK